MLKVQDASQGYERLFNFITYVARSRHLYVHVKTSRTNTVLSVRHRFVATLISLYTKQVCEPLEEA